MNLVRATLRSDNTVFAQLDLDLGPKSVADTAKEMGITTKLDGYPAEGLGGLTRGVSPLEMANAYATLASGGIRNKPIAIKRVVFGDGDVEDLGKPQARTRPLRACRLRGDEDPEAERPRGNGNAREHRLSLGRQDRHHRQLQRRLVRRLHAALLRLRVGRLPQRARRDAKRPRHLGGGRNLPGPDLEQVHAGGEGPELRRLQAADHPDAMVVVLRQVFDRRQLRRHPKLRVRPRHGRRLRSGRHLGRRLQGLRPAPLRKAVIPVRAREDQEAEGQGWGPAAQLP